MSRVLVDTSVWVDHFRRSSAPLSERLRRGGVCCHPFVIGELACGRLRNREEILQALHHLPRAEVAEHHEVLHFVETHALSASGIGWIDAHLLASARLTGVPLWTADRALRNAAGRLGLLPP